MSPSDYDFDDEYDSNEHEGDDDSIDARVWQLLLLINPGDEEAALQQFSDYREIAAHAGDEAPIDAIRKAIDWRSGFYVDAQDTHALVEAINELSARWNVSIDWHGDVDDDDFHADNDASSLFNAAYDRLAEHGYTLWAWETDDGSHAGWITLTRDNEPMRELATVLEINLRLGSDVS